MLIDQNFLKNHQVIGKHKHTEVGLTKMKKIKLEKTIKTGTEVQTKT